MATLYLDPEGGNDANDGLSFVNRVKSISNGLTAARIAPGDTIRLIASPDPQSVGSATWTTTSGNVVLAAAKNLTIDNCETAWTASTNVTVTTQTNRKEGATCVRAAFASGFTTGKAMYRTLPATLNLSAYQQVSLWFLLNTQQALSTYTLNLCSDANGDTVVNALSFDASAPTDFSALNGGWQVIVLDNGAALGSAINSISLTCNADPSTAQISLDNIVACLSASATDCITHRHLIGKNTAGEPEWYPIMSIEGATITLGAPQAATLATDPPRPYRGTTETVTTYARRPLFGGAASGQTTATESGTSSSPFTMTGGWNRTDMSTQTGQSWVSGSYYKSNFFNFGNNNYWNFQNIGVAHYYGSTISYNSTGGQGVFQFLGFVACQSIHSGASEVSQAYDVGNVVAVGDPFTFFAARGQIRYVKARRICNQNKSGSAIFAITEKTSRFTLRPPIRIECSKIDNNAGYIVNPAAGSFELGGLDIIGPTIDNSGPSGNQLNMTNISEVSFFNTTWEAGLPAYVIGPNQGENAIKLIKHGGNVNDHRIITRNCTIKTETVVTHTGSGLSWNMSITLATYVNEHVPAMFQLAQVAFEASTLVTLKCWVRRDNLAMTPGIKVHGGYVNGIPDDIVTWHTAAIDTWQELTITFTPTEAGVIELYAVAYGAISVNSWWDDLTITQA